MFKATLLRMSRKSGAADTFKLLPLSRQWTEIGRPKRKIDKAWAQVGESRSDCACPDNKSHRLQKRRLGDVLG